MTSFLFIWMILAGLLGCSGPSDTTGPVPIEGSTYRIGPNTPTEGSELTVEILRDRRRCERVFRDAATVALDEFPDNDARIQGCLPRVDRAYGEVHLAFRLSDPERIDKTYLLPLEKEDVFVSHRGRDVQFFKLIPHEPTQAGQLFIFIIDHSASMQQRAGLWITSEMMWRYPAN